MPCQISYISGLQSSPPLRTARHSASHWTGCHVTSGTPHHGNGPGEDARVILQSRHKTGNRGIHIRRVAKMAGSSRESSTQPDTKAPQPQPSYLPETSESVNYKVASYAEILRNSKVPLEFRQRGLILRSDLKKEESRAQRRNVFGFDEWREHRSMTRYLRHITSLRLSGIAQGLSGPLYAVIAISSVITVYMTLRETGQLPADWIPLSIDNPTAFSFMSFALSLLLVFRTSTSYGRWDEARKLWGLLVNRSRDLMRQSQSWFPEEDPELLDMMVRWSSAFPHVLQAHLRETNDLRGVLKDVLRPHELEALMTKEFRPNFVVSIMSRIIDEARLPTMERIRCDENLTAFADVFGGCERIIKTPIPLTYTRHTSRFLIIYLLCLPFALWNVCGLILVPVSFGIAFLLLGIEEIGVQIEEPFGILPLEVISATIQRNCEEMHARRSQVLASVPPAVNQMPRQHARGWESLQMGGLAASRGGSPYLRRLEGDPRASPAQLDSSILAMASNAAAAAGAAAAAAASAAHAVANHAGRENGSQSQNGAGTGNGVSSGNGVSVRNGSSSGNGVSTRNDASIFEREAATSSDD